MTRALPVLLCSLAGLAAPALAQSPAISGRVFATVQAGHPMAVSGSLHGVARFDADHALIRTSNAAYLSDGQTLRRIMVAGEQIPGQLAGVVWAAPQNNDAGVWPIDDVGARFIAYATGPGIGDVPQAVNIIGNPLDGPVSILLSNSTGPTTRTGLSWSFASGLTVGPVDGEQSLVIPADYVPAGFTGHLTMQNDVRLNPQGAVVAQFGISTAAVNVILAADQSSIRTVVAGLSTLTTDRGNYALRNNLAIGSAPLPNGDVIVGGFYTERGAARSITWASHTSGANTLIAAYGDRAPGTEPGVTYASVAPVAANARGSVLLSVTLQGPGVTSQNNDAYVLVRHDRSTLILREQPGAPLDFAFPWTRPITLNSDDQVGIIMRSRAVIYTPGLGTTAVARAGQPLPAELGLAGGVSQIGSFYGVMFGETQSGSDEARIPYLSESGELMMTVETQAGSSMVGLRVTAPGCSTDFNNDGFTDFFDYDAFVTCFEGGACPDGRSSDFNNDDFDDFFDYADFVASFESGC